MNHADVTRLRGFPEPRAFQTRALERLREGVRAGHRCQMLMAPTGAGKTFIGMYLIHEALKKGRRAIFVCDRRTLIEQTSAVADRYGLSDHGVIMADHWRRRPHAPLQIASAQTLARRDWPEADLIVVDEAHTQLKAWTEHIPTASSAVVGLSATPFSDGLGNLFSNLVNAASMAELTELGVLTPMRVLSCTRADMRGAETSGGEWTDRAAEERGMEIVGDVVTEWLQHAEGRKTIVFASTINHCRELERSFRGLGVAAATFTSETKAAEREALLADFRGPDAPLRVLISVEALAKGFDVPDVSAVVDCRPLRKSLSTAIQMWGRGLRASQETGKKDCVARGTLVLTDRGDVPIERVTLDHKVWDGENFVSHAGAVCRGMREVIEYDGLIATPDHRVMTDDGWKRFEEAARGQRRIARTGVAGRPVRLADDLLSEGARQREQSARRGGVRALWRKALRALSQSSQAAGHGGVPKLQRALTRACSEVAIRAVPSAVKQVHQPERLGIRALRWARDRVSFLVSERGCTLGGGELGGSRSFAAVGPGGQQRPLRAWEPSLDHSGWQPEQHSRIWRQGAICRLSQGVPRREVRGRDAGADAAEYDTAGDCGALERTSLAQTKREVWDLLNAGPLQRFTANGRLVHNCLLLDHSGNIIRFRADFEELYHNGLDALDDGRKLDRRVREDEEEELDKPTRCPSCGHTPFVRRCMACGHELPPKAVEAEPSGGMREIFIGKAKAADDARHLYAQCATYARMYSAADKQRGRAAHIYRDIVGSWPPRSFDFDSTPDVVISRVVLGKIRQKNIAYAKGRAA